MTYLHVLINPQALPLNPSTAEWFRPCKCPEQDWGSFLFFFFMSGWKLSLLLTYVSGPRPSSLRAMDIGLPV